MPHGSHHGTEVLMMGRSVMGGWFEHWGYDWNEPVTRDGYLLYYREVATPPDIGTDAASAIAAGARRDDRLLQAVLRRLLGERRVRGPVQRR